MRTKLFFLIPHLLFCFQLESGRIDLFKRVRKDITNRVFLLIFIMISCVGEMHAQTDSAEISINKIPIKYLNEINSKADKYSNRVIGKTKRTLLKLAKFESKIKALLEKTDPSLAERLFGNGKMTFGLMLQKFTTGEKTLDNYTSKYNSYTDKLTTGFKYLETKVDSIGLKFKAPLAKAKKAIELVDSTEFKSEMISSLIKERKKELKDAALKYLGKNKYLRRINKESYYYIETLKNYKELFNDQKKAEETALNILNKIPAFNKFMRENGALASLFGRDANGFTTTSLAGLQTRADVSSLIQNRISSAGPNAAQIVQQQMQQAQAELQKFKNKFLQSGGNNNQDMPDFKPNGQKTKTFKQRLERGFNLSVGRSGTNTTSIIDMGISIGYKLNDKSTTGIGISYKMGYGSIQKLSISHEGIGLRSYFDWKAAKDKSKILKNFYLSGGYEFNHITSFKNIRSVISDRQWQQSCLIGIAKKVKIKTKFFKETNIRLLYDFLSNRNIPVTKPWQFRVGYIL